MAVADCLTCQRIVYLCDEFHRRVVIIQHDDLVDDNFLVRGLVSRIPETDHHSVTALIIIRPVSVSRSNLANKHFCHSNRRAALDFSLLGHANIVLEITS